MQSEVGPSPHSLKQLAADTKGTAVGIREKSPVIHEAFRLLVGRSGHMTYETWVGNMSTRPRSHEAGRAPSPAPPRPRWSWHRTTAASLEVRPFDGVDRCYYDWGRGGNPSVRRGHHTRGYSRSLESLESLWASTNEPFRLVWVASGVPRQMRAKLEKYARERQFTLIVTSRYLTPNQARNVGLSAVDTEWVAFVDNDVIYEFGWLEKLLACSVETQAAVVGPLYCIGEPSRNRIHMAGGQSRIVETAEGRDLSETHYFHERDLAEVGNQLTRTKVELVEFHCMLVKMSVLQRTGPLDEGLTALCEHNDICMKVQALGEEVWFEPAARVTYLPTVETLADYLCFCYRWRDSASRATIKHFWASWNLTSNSPAALELMRFTTEHRKLGQPRPKRVNAACSARIAAAVGQIGRLAARPPRSVVIGKADQHRAIA